MLQAGNCVANKQSSMDIIQVNSIAQYTEWDEYLPDTGFVNKHDHALKSHLF